MPLPSVSREAIQVVVEQFRDPAYQHAALDRMKRDNQFLANALDDLAGKFVERDDMDNAKLVVQFVLLQYLCLENQFDAEELERQIG